MIERAVVHVESKQIVSITCDVCHTIYSLDQCNLNYDVRFETQEFLHYENTGGYNSIFGDGAQISIDICQHCVKKLLGQYLQIKDK